MVSPVEFVTQTTPELPIATPWGCLKFDPVGAKLPSRLPLLLSAVTVSPSKFVTQTWPELSIATPSGASKFDPVGAKFSGIDQSFGADASAGLNSAALVATSFTPATDTSAGYRAIDRAAAKVSATDPVPPVHAPALNAAPGSAQSNSSVQSAEEAPLV